MVVSAKILVSEQRFQKFLARNFERVSWYLISADVSANFNDTFGDVIFREPLSGVCCPGVPGNGLGRIHVVQKFTRMKSVFAINLVPFSSDFS